MTIFKTYNELMEKEVTNILGRNCEKVQVADNKELVWVVKDISSLNMDLLDYIEQNYVKKQGGTS